MQKMYPWFGLTMSSEGYELRAEQCDAVRRTYEYWQKCREGGPEPRFLWNAKPRFGKTLTAYSFAQKIQARRVLIVTNRPAVAGGWYADFAKFGFGEAGQSDGVWRWVFTCSNVAKKYLGEPEGALTRQEQMKNPELLRKNFVHFISLQDMKGHKMGDFKAKNAWIFELEWDLVIIDESHEGVETARTLVTFDKVQRKFTLYLSGTPFRVLAEKSFREEQIYNWSYPDEQAAKVSWKDGRANPYADLPTMRLTAYRLPRILGMSEEDLQQEGSGYGFDLAELLRVAKIEGRERFVYEPKVKLLLKNLTRGDYPFAGSERQERLRHTFWLLPGVKACEQMKKLLLEDEFFGRNYTADDIIVAAGEGTSDRAAEAALATVQARIGKDARHTRTITLSCGRLTTGVTIPAWTGVMMLSKCQSPSLYMQAAFRAQNSWQEGGFVKEVCCVYDFTPERALQIVAEIADPEHTSTTERQEKLNNLIKYLPVWAEDKSGKLRKLDAAAILTIPLELVTDEVVSRGFMSNQLFRNVGKIFGSPRDIREIIAKLDEVRPNGEVRRRHKTDLLTLAVPEWQNDSGQRDASGQDGVSGQSSTGEQALKLERRRQSAEAALRDRLRGFARTIPSFLMAYGNEQTRLANFEEGVPEGVFEELTNITKTEFRKLRDGSVNEGPDTAGKPAEVAFDGLFREEVFDAAVQEFYRKRQELADYYKAGVTEDIFAYIPPQQNNQFFTPRAVVKLMVDRVEKLRPEVFRSTQSTFIDLYMKSGLFVAEIVKRIFAGTRAQYESDEVCVKHILEKQVYGLAPTPILATITQNFLFGFDRERRISRENFQEYDITDEARRGAAQDLLEDIFKLGGGEMKFAVVIGNPPYQETVGKSTVQSQSNSSWIYQYFQESADKIGEVSCLIYPFGGWFDAPERLGGLGRKLLGDGHTVSIEAYEATPDRRAWYRNDCEPRPIFGTGANLSAGVAIVLRDLERNYANFEYTNRIYTDERVVVRADTDSTALPPNPAFLRIAQKLGGAKLARRVQKNLFGIESTFVEQNPDKVSRKKSDWQEPIRLLANDRAGSVGRTQIYWTDRANIPRGAEYFGLTKVIMTSAYPKKSLVSGMPTIANVKRRAKSMIEVLPANSAFGASRLALFMSSDAQECQNFLKYTQTDFFAALILQEPNQRSSIGAVIPDQDFTERSDIDWSRSADEINRQLCQKYHLTETELGFLGIVAGRD